MIVIIRYSLTFKIIQKMNFSVTHIYSIIFSVNIIWKGGGWYLKPLLREVVLHGPWASLHVLTECVTLQGLSHDTEWAVSVVSHTGNKVVQSDHSMTCNSSPGKMTDLFVTCYHACCLIKESWALGPASLTHHTTSCVHSIHLDCGISLDLVARE